MIDYTWVTEETKAEFEAVLRKHGLKFMRWRISTARRKSQPIEAAFKHWWMQAGPLGFRTSDDAFRFQRELLTFIERTMLSEVRTLPVSDPDKIAGFRMRDVVIDQCNRPDCEKAGAECVPGQCEHRPSSE